MFSFDRLSSNIRKMLGVQRGRGYNVRCVYKVLNESEILSFVDNAQNVILDVRHEDEFEGMHVKRAINIPANEIVSTIYNVIMDKKTPILVYCSTGERTNYAICKLTNLGYTNLYIWGNGGINTLTVREILEFNTRV